MYGNADHSTGRVIQGDEADGSDGNTKGKSSRLVDGYADSTNFVGED